MHIARGPGPLASDGRTAAGFPRDHRSARAILKDAVRGDSTDRALAWRSETVTDAIKTY